MILRGIELLASLLRVIIGTLMFVLAIPVAMQVIARYTGIIPVYLWTEELATFIFVWIVMMGAALAVWDGTHFDVQVIPESSNPTIRFVQQAVVLSFILIFALLFAWYGIHYTEFGANQNSVMMRANLALIHVTVPIAGVLWAIFSSYRLYEAFVLYRGKHQVMS